MSTEKVYQAEHALRIESLEEKSEEHSALIRKQDARLNQADITFTNIARDREAMTDAIDRLTDMVKKAIDASSTNYGSEAVKALIFWAIPLVGSGVLWAIVHSGAVK